MRKNLGAKSYLFPMPVLIVGTYDKNGTEDAMNVAWDCICGRPQVEINIGKSHKSYENIKNRKAFTVSVADMAHMVEADYFGIVSANDVPDKFEKSGCHAVKSEFVDAPVITEFPITLECSLSDLQDKGTSARVIGDIINVSVDEAILEADGSIDLEKIDAICFDPVKHTYMRLAGPVGNAFKDGEKIK